MITLEQAKAGREDYIDQQIIDTFRRNSLLLDKLVFDDALVPNFGSTLKYTYMRQETPSIASFRKINTEYTPQEATKKEYSVEVKVLGGSIR